MRSSSRHTCGRRGQIQLLQSEAERLSKVTFGCCRFSAPSTDNVSRRWRDGSLELDLPTFLLSEMFNCNHFIVSQTNPHIAPLLNLKKTLSRRWANLLELELRHRYGLQLPAGLHPLLCFFCSHVWPARSHWYQTLGVGCAAMYVSGIISSLCAGGRALGCSPDNRLMC